MILVGPLLLLQVQTVESPRSPGDGCSPAWTLAGASAGGIRGLQRGWGGDGSVGSERGLRGVSGVLGGVGFTLARGLLGAVGTEASRGRAPRGTPGRPRL